MPAFARSLRGAAGFSSNDVTTPPWTSRMPQASGLGAWNTAMAACAEGAASSAATSRRRSKSVRSSPLTARNTSSDADEPSAGERGCRRFRAGWARSSSAPAACPGALPGATRTCSGMWCRLTRTSSTPAARKLSSQRSSRGRPPTGTRHFGTLSVRGRRRVPSPAARRKAFIRPTPGPRRGTSSSRPRRRARRRAPASPSASGRTRPPTPRVCVAGPTPGPRARRRQSRCGGCRRSGTRQ